MMSFESDPFRRRKPSEIDRMPPAEGVVHETAILVDEALLHTSTLTVSRGRVSSLFKDISFTVQSERSVSQSGSRGHLEASLSLQPDSINQTTPVINLTADLELGHSITIGAITIEDSLTAQAIGRSIFTFIRGALDLENNPNRITDTQFQSDARTLYSNARNAFRYANTASIPEVTPNEGFEERDSKFFATMPQSIFDAIQQSGRGDFIASQRRNVATPSRTIDVASTRITTYWHGEVDTVSEERSVTVSCDDECWDAVARIPVVKQQKLTIAETNLAPVITDTVTPTGDVKFNRGFEYPPFSASHARLIRKYTKSEERLSTHGDVLDFKDVLSESVH